MEFKASGRAALVVAAGLWMGLSGLATIGSLDSAQAAPSSGKAASDKPAPAKPHAVKKPVKHSASTKAEHKIVAAKSEPADAKPAVGAALASAADTEAPLPDSVANANARMADAAQNPDTPATGQAVAPNPNAEAQLVASDQLNDVDLAASAEASPQQNVGQSTAAVTAMASPDDTLWRQTSLIGKIFIAFGGLLTVASAARMFIA
jgi:hypothetical protein